MSSPDPAARAAPGPPRGSSPRSPILSIDRDDPEPYERFAVMHSHPEPMLLWAATATLGVTTASREWLVPPGYGLWVPGGTRHSVAALHFGQGSAMTFDPSRSPIAWTEPTGVTIGPLLHELITHLHRAGPQDPSRPHAEALFFALLAPLPTHAIRLSMPTDPRIRVIAEQLVKSPADQRELAAWADQVHAGVRTLSRLFRAETGLSFTDWRAQVRMRAAVQLLASGTTVNATARAVGYRKPSAFIEAFRRATGQTPGTYIHTDTTAPGQAPGT